MQTTTFLVIVLCSNLVLTISLKIINDSKLMELQEYDNTAGERRIIGGENVTNISQYPYMAFIYMKYDIVNRKADSMCTGSIITPTLVLTAAHCVFNLEENRFGIKNSTIVTGTVDWLHPGQRSKLKTIYVHPKFEIPIFDRKCALEYDIAILELKQPLKFNENVSAVTLPAPARLGDDQSLTAQYAEGGKACTALGWGKIKYEQINDSNKSEIFTSFLKKIEAQLISNKECQSVRLSHLPPLCEETQICIRDKSGNTGICSGDSGGPLVCDGQQLGVTSHGMGDSELTNCNGPLTTNMYTRVDVFIDFIEDIKNKTTAANHSSTIQAITTNLIITLAFILLKLQ